MPRYRVHRIKESQKEHFRWSAHTGGLAIVRQKDYEVGGEVESLTFYSLWKELQAQDSAQNEKPLSPGDVVEIVESEGPGRLFIAKYIGFEPAQWFVPPAPTDGPQSSSSNPLSAALPEQALL